MQSFCTIYVLTYFTFIFNLSDGAGQTLFDGNNAEANPLLDPGQDSRRVGLTTLTGNTLLGTINLHPLPGIKSPCVTHLPFYPVYISKEFPDGLIKLFGHNKNMWCYCDYRFTDLMTCDIFVRPDSDEEKMIKKRFAYGDSEANMRLRPFFTLPMGRLPYRWTDEGIQVLYAHPSCMPIVTAYITVYLSPIQPLLRSRSHPKRLITPIRYIPISQCTRQEGAIDQAICPIMMTPFEIDEFVYILKRDYAKVRQGHPVVCICFAGMIGLEKQRNDLQFQDPLRRLGNTASTIRDDYDLYRIINDPLDACEGNSNSSELSLEQRVATSFQSRILPLRFLFILSIILGALFYYRFIYISRDSHEVYIEIGTYIF